jgi:hypothetical protein
MDRDQSPETKLQSARALQENALLRTMIQEEIIPGHGSIYTRSIAPGPGYYGAPSPMSLEDGKCGVFGHRPKGRIDSVTEASKDQPGPGEYSPKARQLELNPQLGKFDKAIKSSIVAPVDIARKLPFISALASECEGHSIHSPAYFHTISPEAPQHTRSFAKSAKYSFGKMRRPF